jgi:hypothetical protein
MKQEIEVREIKRNKNVITYDFTYSEELKKYFNSQEKFFIEYGIDGNEELDITTIPDSILIIPFLCNVLPVAWILDAEIRVREVDKSFYDSIPEFKNGYINMYPQIEFKGDLTADKIIKNKQENVTAKNRLSFFSGGVDAFNTLINHIDEKTVLMTLWGSDVFFDDIIGWNNVKQHTEKTATQFGIKYLFIKSNFRKFLHEGALSDFVVKNAGDGWWHGFQNGLGLIGHAAPLACLYNVDIVRIASSYSSKYIGKIVDASDPTIDNHVKFADSRVIHDGYEFSRQDKIKNITKYVSEHNKNIELRVCWQSSGGKNCCKCEKCYRTIMGILVEGENPNAFGLAYKKEDSSKIKILIKYKTKMNYLISVFWQDIQQRFIQNREILEKHPELKWIYTIDFDKVNENPIKRGYISMMKIRALLWRIIAKTKNTLFK